MGRARNTLVAIAILLSTSCMTNSRKSLPPMARKVSFTDTTHGYARSDEYRWLRDKSNPEVLDYLQAENEFTRQAMAHTENMQKSLFDEMKSRIKETDETVPYRHGPYDYYSRTEKDRQYSIYCRKRTEPSASEEVILDVNQLEEGHDYTQIGVLCLNTRHDILAYSIDHDGSEKYTMRFKDLRSGQMLPDRIERTYYSAEWANDNRTFFYVTTDGTNRPYRLYRHVLGTDPAQDTLIYEETDERFFMTLNKSRSDRFLFLELNSQITSEVRYLDADHPDGPFRTVLPRRHGIEYSITHRADSFIMTTNDDAVNFKVLVIPVSDIGQAAWRELVPHREDVVIEHTDAFKDYLILLERTGGLNRFHVIDVLAQTDYYVNFDEPTFAITGSDNYVYNTRVFRYQFSSPLTPTTVVDFDLAGRRRTILKQDEIFGFDPSQYTSERLHAKASDGALVPISIVRKKSTRPGAGTPLLLYAYGAYGSSSEAHFKSNLISLLDRGFIYAVAHVRGGQELGRRWYYDGKLMKKMNSFTDFVSCAEHLIQKGYTSSDRLAIMGASAGGLLMGAVTNMRPDLFHVVVAQVPFVDVLNTMLDPTLPLTVIEYEEWGNPNEKDQYEYMAEYSPYDNVHRTSYPHLLVTAGLNDPRVAYWEPAKWVARLRTTKTDQNLLLLKTNMGAGHGGASGRYDYLRDVAFEYAFLMDRMGMAGSVKE